tara:strand:- start:293 stop:1120 length:828 start_codon:yes stop_codon:yes gene_type:complete
MKSMALIKCYECGKEISDKAPSCPHCGAPKLVAANKEVKTKKSLALSKYLKPIGIGLGVIFIPLAAVASVPLIQANGNINSVVWRFQNQKFIKDRCYLNRFREGAQAKKCKSLLFKLGEKAEKISKKPHSYCIGLKKVKDISSYEECIRQEDKMIKKQKELERLARKARNQLKGIDAIIYKGKTYTASRKCPVGQNMYWSFTSGFMRKTKVSELGCMTKVQNEEYWRQYKLQKAGAPRVTGGGSGSNFLQQQQINRNRMNNWENTWRRQNNITDY